MLASAAVVSLALFTAAPGLFAQQVSNELTQYTSAVALANPSDRVVQLERFAIHAQSTPLKIEALEFVVWEYLHTHSDVRALAWARPLSDVDPDNPVAIALLSNEARQSMEKGQMKPEKVLAMARRGLDNLPQLRRPLGMNESEFTQLNRQVNALLSGAAGTAEMRMKDYVAARMYLHNAVYVNANSVQDTYALGLADLSGPDKNAKEGYWYLARAVNLAQGTPEGLEMARYARAQYVKDGGSTSAWNDYLASAKPTGTSTRPTPPVQLASINPPPPHVVPRPPQQGSKSGQTASASPPPHVVPRPPQQTSKPVQTASVKPPSVSAPKNTQPAPSVWADTANPPVVRQRRIPATTGPMSLGILVETSLATKENRSAVVNSLIDMTRHMSDKDEAFILTYDNNLVFNQDLTTDPHALEEAMESIKPQKGAVLDDAIAFAAGHLARIAKYPNRILLVVSDGKNVDSHASTIETSAEINGAGVRIFCIGLNVDDADGRSRLQALAASTGGQSRFIGSPGQFRDATRQMAQNMGIDFRY